MGVSVCICVKSVVVICHHKPPDLITFFLFLENILHSVSCLPSKQILDFILTAFSRAHCWQRYVLCWVLFVTFVCTEIMVSLDDLHTKEFLSIVQNMLLPYYFTLK